MLEGGPHAGSLNFFMKILQDRRRDRIIPLKRRKEGKVSSEYTDLLKGRYRHIDKWTYVLSHANLADALVNTIQPGLVEFANLKLLFVVALRLATVFV